MNVSGRQNVVSNKLEIVVTADNSELHAMGRAAYEKASELLIDKMVEEIMIRHGNTIIAGLDTKLVTNLAVARFVERLSEEQTKRV